MDEAHPAHVHGPHSSPFHELLGEVDGQLDQLVLPVVHTGPDGEGDPERVVRGPPLEVGIEGVMGTTGQPPRLDLEDIAVAENARVDHCGHVLCGNSLATLCRGRFHIQCDGEGIYHCEVRRC